MLTVREWRRAKEISQAEMAKRLGVHVNTYQNWEKKPKTITIENGVKIAKALEVPMNDIDFSVDEDED